MSPMGAPSSNNSKLGFRHLHSFFQKRRKAEQHESIKENNHGGDPIESRDENTTRFVFGNVNGLKLGITSEHFDGMCKEFQAMEADIVGMSEVNYDSLHYEANQMIFQTLTRNFHHSSLSAATSSIKAEKIFKPGGCITLLHGDLVGRIKEKGHDSLGRWAYHKLYGQEGKIVTVVSAYQVCDQLRQTAESKGFTAYAQQEILLRQQGRKNINPRANFVADLQAFLSECNTAGELIILGGDFNEVLGSRSKLAAMFHRPEIQLVDVIEMMHPEVRDLPTYDRGSSRLDYLMVSQSIAHHFTKSGYLPFRLYIESDHRLMYADIPTDLLFGDTAKLAPKAQREFRSNDPRAVRTYVTHKYQHLLENGVFEMIKELKQTTEPRPELAEKVDALLVQAGRHAAKKCKKENKQWWSTDLARASEKVRILNTALARATKNIDYDKVNARRNQELIQLDFQPPKEISEIRKALRQAQLERKEIRDNARSYRDEYLMREAAAASLVGDREQEKIKSQLLQREQTRAMWKKISNFHKPNYKKGISSVEVPASWPVDDEGFLGPIEDPKGCKEWKMIDTPAELNFYLRKRNQLHFGQAQGTPFTVPPLSVMVDWQASSITVDQILEGEFTAEEIDAQAQELLRHCKREIGVTEKDHENAVPITVDQWKQRIKKWKEETSTSPSGIHLGHAKILLARHGLDPKSLEGSTMTSQQEAIIQAHVDLLNYVTRHRHSLDRWKVVVNVMIEKIPGNHQIFRLRVIHIYEHDYGLYLALYWKQMMVESEARGTINQGQFGGRKGKDAQSLVLLEELKNEICHLSRKSLVNFDNDATSCYDRILVSLANLIGRSKGIHKNVVFVHATTLKEARYKLRTAMGVSDEFYQHSEAFPIYGTGQGSTNSPDIWTIVSSKLFDIHNEKAHGATFSTPDQSLSVTFSIVGFVDDSNCNTNRFLENDQSAVDTLLAAAQGDAQLWNDLLWTSGGRLELPKCSYHLLHFQFQPDGTPIMHTGLRLGEPITIQDSHNHNKISIPQMSAYQAHKTLGHFRAPAGSAKTQLLDLKRKSDMIGRKAATSPFSLQEARIYYEMVYLPSMRYSAPQCFYNKKHWKYVETSAQKIFAQRCGLCSTTSLAVRFGPPAYGGMGFTRLEVLQGEGQIMHILKHLRTSSIVSKLLRIAMAWAQFSAGTSWPILATPTVPLPHLEGRWIKSARNFLASIDGRIISNGDNVPTTQRQDDWYIMDHAMELQQFSNHELCRINYCRLYLQAITVSDICNATGNSIDPAMLSGSPSLLSSSSKLIHVTQARPDERSWRIWRRFMSFTNNRLAHEPLGEWTMPPKQLRRTWHAYFDQLSSYIYVRTIDGFLKCKPNRDYVYFYGSTRTTDPPETAIPVDIVNQTGTTFVMAAPPTLPENTTDPEGQIHLSFESYIATLPASEKSLLENVKFIEVGPLEFVDRCDRMARKGKPAVLILVSDGSSADESMSFGWKCIFKDDGTVIATGSGPAFGYKANSYRAEGYGLVSGALFVHHALLYAQHSPKVNLRFWCDNKGFVDRYNSLRPYLDHFPTLTLQPDWDLLRTLQLLLLALDPAHTLAHVKGHQDTSTKRHEMTIEAKLNVNADEYAGQYRRQNPEYRPLVPRLKWNPAQLEIGGKTIVANYSQAIRYAAAAPAMRDYLYKKFSFTEAIMDKIDWPTYEASIKLFPNRHVTLVKLSNGILPTNSVQFKRQSCQSPVCPRCQAYTETNDHLFRCPVPECSAWRRATFQSIATTSRARPDHHDELADLFTRGLEAWCAKVPLLPSDYPDRFHDLVQSQNRIGWGQVFRGRVSILWTRHFDEYLQENHKSSIYTSGHMWMKNILKVVIERVFVLWEDRNKDVHGATSNDKNRLQKKLLLQELQQLHAHRDLMIPSDTVFLLAPTLQENSAIATFVNSHGVTAIRNWIYTNKPLFLHSIAEAKRMAVQNTHAITKFFRPIVPTQANLQQAILRRANRALPRRRIKKPPDPTGPPLPYYFSRTETGMRQSRLAQSTGDSTPL